VDPGGSPAAWLKQFARPLLISVLVLAGSLGFTALAWRGAETAVEQRLQANFDFRVRDAERRITGRIGNYEQTLRGIAGLFAATADVDRSSFGRYVASLDLGRNTPGIQAVGFQRIVPGAAREAHVAAMRGEGLPTYVIRPEGPRDLLAPIVFVEPFDGPNLRAVGFDPLSEPVRRAALERARDTGAAALSGKVTLVQESGAEARPGGVLFLPVYRAGALPPTADERRASAIGWVYMAFRVDDLMAGLLGERALDLDVELYDGATPSAGSMLYNPEGAAFALEHPESRFQTERSLDVGGHRWTLAIRSTGRFERRMGGDQPRVIGIAGFTVGALLALVAFLLASSRSRVQAALDRSEQRYRDIVDLSPDAIFVNRDDRIDFVNQAGLSLFGAERGEQIIGRSPFEVFHPDSHALLRERIPRLLQGSKVPFVRERVVRLDGSTREVEVAASPFQDAQGTAIQVVLHDLTGQLQREAALQASERHFRDLVRFLPVPIALNDPRGRIVDINDRFTQVLGYTLQDVPTLDDWFSRAYPDEAYRRQVLETWGEAIGRAAASGGEVAPGEYRVTTRTGDVRTMLISGVQVGENLLVTFIDVTERKRADELLRLQQSRLDLAVRSARTGLWDLDLVTNKAWRTLQHDQLFGYDELQPSWGPEEALRHVVPEDRPVFERAFEEAMVTGHFHYELRIQPGDQPQRWIEASGEVFRDEAGKPVRMAGTVLDVSERKWAEERVRAASAYARSLIEASLDPLVTISPEGKVTDVNAATEAVTGIPRDRIIGTDFADSFTEPEKARAGYQQVLATGIVRDYPLTIRHVSGRTTEVIYSATVYRDQHGEVQGVLAAARDITEVRALQAKLAQASRLAAMGTLVAGVAHEINNPLAAELAGQGVAMEVLRDVRRQILESAVLDRSGAVRLLDDAAEALGDAQAGGQRVARIVKDMAALARPDPKRAPVSLAEILEDAMNWLPTGVRQTAEIRVENHGAADVLASAGQIQQVVVNLLTNAARAAPAGRRGDILVRIGPGSPGMARLEVLDHGVGIAPELLDRIFDPFFTTRSVGEGRGTGLGLAICHAIVTAHGGTLTVTSEVGRGSTFRLELPIDPAGA
jgi:PAS domain S-box-containing protein